MIQYKHYKESGIFWTPLIPSEWETTYLRYILHKENREKAPDAELLICSNSGKVTKRGDSRLGLVAESDEVYQGVKKGDLLIHGMDTWHGAIGISEYDGMCTPVVHVCSSSQNKGFVAYYLKMMANAKVFKLISNGVRQNTSDFRSWDKVARLPIFLPSPKEQDRIVSFLDNKIEKIDSFKIQKEKEIQVLNELKQAEIAAVVTRGLNPNAPLAFFDTPLKTEHPAHWKRVRNMTFLIEQTEKVGAKSSDYQLLSLTTNGIIVRDVESGKGKFPKDFDTYKIVEPNDLVFCLFDIDETPRTVGLSSNHGMLTGAYEVFKVRTDIVNPQFVYAFYLAIDNIKALRPYYSGLRKVVKHNRFMQIGFPLPPIEEQNEIVEYISRKNAQIDSMIETLKAEIEHLNEYKQRLISDVITGKINLQDE